MTLLEVLFLLAVGGLAGVLSQISLGLSFGGLLTDAGIGFLGGLIGSWVPRLANVPDLVILRMSCVEFPVLWAMLGGLTCIALLRRLAEPLPEQV